MTCKYILFCVCLIWLSSSAHVRCSCLYLFCHAWCLVFMLIINIYLSNGALFVLQVDVYVYVYDHQQVMFVLQADVYGPLALFWHSSEASRFTRLDHFLFLPILCRDNNFIAHFPICPPLYVQINWIFSIFSLLHVDQLNQHDICRINFSFFFPLHSVSTNWISFSTPLVDPINFLKTSFPKQFRNKKATLSLTRDMRL